MTEYGTASVHRGSPRKYVFVLTYACSSIPLAQFTWCAKFVVSVINIYSDHLALQIHLEQLTKLLPVTETDC